VSEWSFLTNHARALLCVAHDRGIRLRDIAAALDVTERTAFGIVGDLTAAGYLEKRRDGRRNRYEIRRDLPLPEAAARDRTVGQLLELLAGDDFVHESAVDARG
jgi:DNA-binding IclR family transcriptional regulator